VKHLISFSGGIGSTISAIVAHENNLDYELIFCDTLIEDEDLYRFNIDVANTLKKEIIVLKDGRTPWDVFVDRKYIGNDRLAHCSQELKKDQFEKYLNTRNDISPENCFIVLGMSYDEKERIDKAKKHWLPYKVKSLSIEYKVYRNTWQDLLLKYKLQRPRLYDYGFPHNNCGGFCVKAGQKQFLTLLQTNPERYKFHEEKELETIEIIGPTARPFLSIYRDGKKSFITLKEFRELVEQGKITVNPFDYSGCGCFTD
jgi:hypothetical protein